jgi:hypothetical protein
MPTPNPDALERAVTTIFDFLADRIQAADGQPVPLLEFAMSQVIELTTTLNAIHSTSSAIPVGE